MNKTCIITNVVLSPYLVRAISRTRYAHMPPPPLILKSTNSILMTLYSTFYKNCSHCISAICFKIGLGLAEIIRCLCSKLVTVQDCA